MIDLAIDGVDRIVPRVPERDSQRRPRRPFPPVEGEEEDDTDAGPPQAPPPESKRSPDDADDDRLIDIKVRCRFLPTRQEFPPIGSAVTLH